MNAFLRVTLRLFSLVILLAVTASLSPARAAISSTLDGAPSGEPSTVVTDPVIVRDGVIDLGFGGWRMYFAALDKSNGYAYYATYGDPAKIYKIKLSDFTFASTLTLPAGEGNITAGAIDASGTYGYFGTSAMGQQPKIVKVQLASMSRVSALALDTGEKAVTGAVMDPRGGYAYFGLYCDPGAGRIIKVRVPDLVREGTSYLDDSQIMINSPAFGVTNGEYIFFGTMYMDKFGSIIRILPSEFPEAWALPIPYETYSSSGYDSNSGHVFFGSSTNFRRIQPDDFAPVSTLTMPSKVLATAIDSARGYAYLALENAQIIQIRLSDMTTVATLNLDPFAEGVGDSAVLDWQSGYAYLALSTNKILRLKIGDPIILDKKTFLPVIGR